MTPLIDKHIHENEFRLRILLNDYCNMECHNCLNDFQKKEYNSISPFIVEKIIKRYVLFCATINVNPIVSFSGGEPGIHPNFIEIVTNARKYKNLKVQINTNGAIDGYTWDKSNLDIRYHVGPGMLNQINKGQTAVLVIMENWTVEKIIQILTPFYLGGMKIKTFVDFYASDVFQEVYYPILLKKINEVIPVSGRHTGIQINRGSGCINCKKRCVTLKALWMFSDNTYAPCPQRSEFRGTITENMFWNAYNFHTF